LCAASASSGRKRNDDEENRRKNEAPTEALEERAVSVGADHPWQVMTHGAKGGDKKVNVLRAPSGLGQSKQRQDQNRRPDVKNKVAPAVQYPKILLRYGRWYGWYRLRPGKASNVLHVAGG
jgi:hypothetical protein